MLTGCLRPRQCREGVKTNATALSVVIVTVAFLLALLCTVATAGYAQTDRELLSPPADLTGGLKYRDILEVGNAVNPSGLVVLLHGLGDSCHGVHGMVESLAQRLPHLLFLVPSAALLPQTHLKGVVRPAWFDIVRRTTSHLSTGEQDVESLMQSVSYVSALALRRAEHHKISTDRVCVGGFSQGAATATALALASDALLPAGVFILSGFLPAKEAVLARHEALMAANPQYAARFHDSDKAITFAMFHGRQDPVIHLAVAEETKAVIQAVLGSGGRVELTEYPMTHQVSAEELDDVTAFLSRVLPPPAGRGSENEDL